ncbi:MAG TPA: ECF-type sigma factor [Verrucomicrobiae bacterium]|nr:ECF-type sigma factor [Verrucomicrobiae bacterium]
MSDITHVLDRVRDGDALAAGELLPLVYEELRKLASARMAQEQAGQTLQPTALVHEAWLRLTGEEQPCFDGRGHFFAAAAEAMRRILIENARRKGRLKRGGEWERVGLENLNVAVVTDDDLRRDRRRGIERAHEGQTTMNGQETHQGQLRFRPKESRWRSRCRR